MPGFRNPYESSHATHNLFQFLSLHDPSTEALLLVGEAPGYRGAAVSGVALTSLSVLLASDDDPWDAFGHHRYREPHRGGAPHLREATATMVWRVLKVQLASEPLPLTWNAVPFHPVGSTTDSNRSVRAHEIEIGTQWIERFLDMFPCSKPLAVGRTASAALGSAGIEHTRIRHPARGGFRDFEAGIKSQV